LETKKEIAMPRAKGPHPPEYWKLQYQKQKARGETKDQLERQQARREYDKKGIDRAGKDIDHIKPIRAGGKTSAGNLRLRNPSANQADNYHGTGKKKK
tara:strand:+ start:307 stop:600 length:294 start_codon:yes stop_codon:yes gene_type:complete